MYYPYQPMNKIFFVERFLLVYTNKIKNDLTQNKLYSIYSIFAVV